MPAGGEDDFIAKLLPKVDETVDRFLIHVEKGQYEGVEVGLEVLLREHPQYHTTNFAMGAYLLATLEDTERAIPFFEKAVSVFPPIAEAHYNLGSCYMKSCRIPEAVASLRKAIRYTAYNELVANKARDQLQFLEKLLTDRSPFQTLDAYVENQKLFDLAFENLQARRYEAAIDMFNRVLAQFPGHVQSHGNLALAYAGLGRKALALENLEKGLALDPTYEPAIQNRKVIEAMKEAEAPPPLIMATSEYYLDRLKAEKSLAQPGWRQGKKALTAG